MFVPRVIVKFRDDLINEKNPNVDGFRAELLQGKVKGTEWPQLIGQPQFKGLDIQKLLTAITEARLVDLVNEAIQGDPIYRQRHANLFTYFKIPCPPSVNPDALVKALLTWQAVETAFVEGEPAPPPQVLKGQNPAWALDTTAYLRLAPQGIDAEYAWDVLGGDGGKRDGIALQFFDIESDWNENHPDLHPANPLFTAYGFRSGRVLQTDHGSSTLGVVIASDANPPSTQSSLGITPYVATNLLASYWLDNSNTDHYNAILFAIDKLRLGDVLLLESQVYGPTSVGRSLAPVEFEDDNFHAIQLGTALGIVIVEPAGNEGLDKKDNTTAFDIGTFGKRWLRQRNEEDSGAIIVSAATPWTNGGPPPDFVHVPITNASAARSHNWGDRIDCYAWGDMIYTTHANGYGFFGDTSGASAIIAGAALSLQGMHEKHFGRRLHSREIRKILSDPVTGTIAGSNTAPPNAPLPPNWNQHQIGVMPDLRAISVKIGFPQIAGRGGGGGGGGGGGRGGGGGGR